MKQTLLLKKHQNGRQLLRLLLFLFVVAGLFSGVRSARAVSPDIVISQVYGGGGNSGATYTHDFIELFNRGTTAVSISGWSVQYASATGTTWQKTDLAGTLQPGQYYLIQQAAGTGGTTSLPTPDAAGTIAMSATNGKVALVNSTTLLSGSCPLASTVDFVGFGATANCFEGAGATPTLGNTTDAIRLNNGCTDTDNNAADFVVSAPNPRNTASPLAPCVAPTSPTGTGAANPDPVTAGGTTLLTVTVIPGSNPTSTGLAVSGDLTAIGGPAAQSFADNGTGGDAAAGDNVFSYLASVPGAISAGAKSLSVSISDAQGRTGSTTIDLTVQSPTPAGGNIVISQVYGGGGNSGATLTHDFIELYNRSGSPVNITGWSVQYASSAGTSWQVTALSGTIQPGSYYLIQQAAGAGGTTPLPTPNATGTIAMSATSGKVALVNNTTALSGTGCPIATPVVDFVGYGSANCFEGSGPTGTLSNTSAALRNGAGSVDTDNNTPDFTVGAPNPRNTPPPISLSIDDVTLNEGNSGTTTFSFAVSLSSPAGAGGVTFDISTADGTAAAPGDYAAKSLTGQTIPAGSSTYTFDVLVNGDTVDEPDETFFVNITNVSGVSSVLDNQGLGTILNDDTDLCMLSYTPAYTIQGSGLAAAVTGPITTQGVVIGDYEGPSPTLRGFYLQDLAGDGDTATSDAIFVFNGSNNSVSLGDVVRVTGTAGEFQDQTQISSVTSIVACGTGSVTPVDVTLPFPSVSFAERYEGMLVRFPQTLYVTEHFQLGRFGQVVMSADGRLAQPTNVVAPGAPALALQAANNLNRIIVDDDLQNQNPDPIIFGRGGSPLSASNTLRGGDTATGIVGVLTYTWAGNAASGNAYRLRPLTALGGGVPNFVAANPRPAGPSPVGGTLRVSALNLLNYFNTFADSNPATPGCFPSGNDSDCRGANSATEFTRQSDKTVAAILAINPDVLGVNEIENDGYGPASAIQDLVDKLNAATAPGTYAFIDFDAASSQTNALGTDAIKVGLIYKPASVTPVGTSAVLNSVAFVNGGDPAPRNRATFAQAFEQPNGARFIVSVNHLKSKGSACSVPDAGDGQGNCNVVRTNAANTLAAWLASDPTGTGDGDILIIGDLNSYAMEDPITALQNAGYTNMISSFLGAEAYSFVFDGQWGYLDHALASSSLAGQVTGVSEYHINADEPNVLDYNVDFKSPGQIISLYAPNEFRVSDHDPVILGLDLNAPPTVSAGGPYSVNEGGSVLLTAAGSDPNGDTLTYAWDLDNNGSFETAGQSATFSAAALDGPGSAIVAVRATDGGGLTAVAQATVTINNVAPVVGPPLVSPSPSLLNAAVTASAIFTDTAPNDAPFTCTVNYGDGSGPQAGIVSGGTCTGPSHTYTAVGSFAVTIAVTDKDGGTGLQSTLHSVVFNFTGFFAPVENLPAVNSVKAGSSLPIKFSLGGDMGLGIINVNYPRSIRVACNVNDQVNDIDDTSTVTAGSSSLSYDPVTGQYIYVWKTEKSWAGTCRQFSIKLTDGTVHVANFKFK